MSRWWAVGVVAGVTLVVLSLPFIVRQLGSKKLRQGERSQNPVLFACPRERLRDLRVAYKRKSLTPMLYIQSRRGKRPCGLIKLSCRLAAPTNDSDSLIVKDEGRGHLRYPALDSAWSEVLVTNALRLAENTSLPAWSFGHGVVLSPSSPLFDNVEQLPSTCLWSGKIMGYLQRFQPVHRQVLNRRTYDTLVKSNNVSLDALGSLWVADALTLKFDRGSTYNLFKSHATHSFVPLDVEGIVVSDLKLPVVVRRVRSPPLLHLSGLREGAKSHIRRHALNIAIQMCGAVEGSCIGLRTRLSTALAQDPFFSELMNLPERVVERVRFCAGRARVPAAEKKKEKNEKQHNLVGDRNDGSQAARKLGGSMTQTFSTCCPSPRWSPAQRSVCNTLQQRISPNVIQAGNTSAIELLSWIVSRRLETIRDQLRLQTK